MKLLRAAVLAALLPVSVVADRGVVTYHPARVPNTPDIASCGEYIAASSRTTLGRLTLLAQTGETYYGEASLWDEWTRGFISAYNRIAFESDWPQVKATPSAAIGWLRSYCTEHPTASYFNAVSLFVQQNSMR